MKNLNSLASSPRRIRQSNAIAALNELHRSGRLSRADLARRLGLNRSSSGNIIAELASAGFVREVQTASRKRSGNIRAGRPGILIELVPDAAFFVGAEIGVEHITTVQIDLSAEIVRSSIEPFDGSSVPVGEAIVRAVEQAFRDIPENELRRCEGFGLSAPAQMDGAGYTSVAPILGWHDVNVAELAKSTLPVTVPVLAENDANAFAIGATYGKSTAQSGVTVFFVIESGIGGGVVIDGRLFRGRRGLAGEIGHLKVPGRDERNLEQAIGLTRILSHYRAGRNCPALSLENFLADVHDRVPDAIVIAEDWALTLAFAIVQVSRVIDPDRIVLGGSLAELYPLVAARVSAHIRRLQAPTFPIPDIVLNENAPYGSAFGAACMMHQRFFSLENERFSEDISGSDTAEKPDPGISQ